MKPKMPRIQSLLLFLIPVISYLRGLCNAAVINSPPRIIATEKGSTVTLRYVFNASRPHVDVNRLYLNGSLHVSIIVTGTPDELKRPGTDFQYIVNTDPVKNQYVSITIVDVRVADVGNFIMNEYDGLTKLAEATRTALVVYDALPVWNALSSKGELSLRFNFHGHVNLSVSCSNGTNLQPLPIGRPGEAGVWCFSNVLPNVQQCTTTLEVTNNCSQSCKWTYTSAVTQSGYDVMQCSSINGSIPSAVTSSFTNDVTTTEVAETDQTTSVSTGVGTKTYVLSIIIPLLVVGIIVVIVSVCYHRKKQRLREQQRTTSDGNIYSGISSMV